MTDDLGARLEAAARHAPEGTPDLGLVVEHGKRTRMIRSAGAAFGTVAIASVATFAAMNIDFGPQENPAPPAQHDDGAIVPAEPGEPTYVLTHLKVQKGPYVDRNCVRRGGPNSLCGTSSMVAVSYEWRWSTDRFPGIVTCQIEIFKGDRSLGHATWDLSGLEASSRRKDVIPVPSSGRVPDRAEGACEAGTLEQGPPYRFTFVRAERYNALEGFPSREPLYRYRMFFEIEALAEHSTGMCYSTVRYESGKTIKGSFTQTGTPPAGKLQQLGAPFKGGDPLVDADVRCSLYKREVKR